MTILTVTNLKEYSMLAADTRTINRQYINESDYKDSFKDGKCKIIETNIGYLASTGFEELSEVVNKRVINDNIKSIKDIENIILQEKIKFKNKYINSTIFQKYIEKTSWIATYKNDEGDIESSYYCIENNCFCKIIGEVFILGFGFKNEKTILPNYFEQKQFYGLKKHKLNELEKSIKNSEIWTALKITGMAEKIQDVSKDFYIATHFKNKKNKLELFDINNL